MGRFSVRMRCFAVALGLAALLLAACTEKERGTASVSVVPKALTGVVLPEKPADYDIPLDINFDNKIRLLGVDVSPKPLKPGLPYSLTLTFEALAPISEDYEFFGHFEPRRKKLKARVKMDHPLTAGKYPPRQWKPGQIIRDTYRAKMPAEFPDDKGVLWGGLYLGDTRLPVVGEKSVPVDKQARARLAVLEVEKTRISPRKLTVYRAIDPIVPDGKLTEKSWERATSTGYFRRYDGDGPADPRTLAKFLWDDTHLYIAFVAEDDDIWTTYTQHDDPLYKEECVEVMIDADGSGQTYFEFQVNAANAGYDASFESRRTGRDLAWNSGMRHGVHVEGTLNKRDDRDNRWTVEIAIPLSAIRDAANIPPKAGDLWRLNVYRLEKPREGGTRGSMWSPTLVGDFHVLERFGVIEFSGTPVDKRPSRKVAELKQYESPRYNKTDAAQDAAAEDAPEKP